ncbi:hypothetical protein PsorP6_006693 [Peronosclerospora sorghi]|uniref:Uncharacterized protein n=1 Tax=Peronosclerospora sorghi TaxID=230839 RepID=A0ACC0W0K1_9STRA|nr:hypothetical protein PsorP6_006693 [Peronosclerospora sorghi]
MRRKLWTFVAPVAVLLAAKVALVVSERSDCVEPSTVHALETKVSELRDANAALERHVESQRAEHAQLLTKMATEQEEVVVTLKQEIETLKQHVTTLESEVAQETKRAATKETEVETVLETLSKETARVVSCERELLKREEDLIEERANVAAAEAALQSTQSQLAAATKQVTQLEKRYSVLEKKTTALTKELGVAKSMELTLAALLSSYYDDALVLLEQTLDFAHEKMSAQSSTLERVQSTIEDVTNTARETTNKFYHENLATTLDPIVVNVRNKVDPVLADVHEAVRPHLTTHLPLVHHMVAKAKDHVVVFLQAALVRAKVVRHKTIMLLAQNEHVGVHAQKIVDAVLLTLCVPLVLFHLRLVVRLAWWSVTTTLCVLTCGLCCGRKRPTKTKRKMKTPSGYTKGTACVTGSLKKGSTSKTTMGSQTRSKKGKL